MKIYKSALIILILVSVSLAQFVDVEVKIETNSLKPQEQSDLEYLNDQIKSYYEDYEWTENEYGIALPIRVSMYIQNATLSGTERKFSGQVIFVTHSNDIQLLEKQLKFVYSQNESLMHTPEIKSLPTILDFYAYFLIGSEQDTYEPLGGTSIFEKARSIASRAQMSNYAAGWTERLKTLNEYLDLRFFRKYKYYYWSIIDLETNGEKDAIHEAIDQALYYLEKELEINNRNRYIHLFLDAHAKDLADLLTLYGNKEQQEKLLALDPDNRNIYQKAFSK